MDYTVVNENLKANCFPIIITLLNLTAVNQKVVNKTIIRTAIFIYGIVGGIILYNILSNTIRLQTAFEWIMLYSVIYYPIFVVFRNKQDKRIQNYINNKEKHAGLHYTEEEIDNSELVAEKITSLGNFALGVAILALTLFPCFRKIVVKETSELYLIAKYNYVVASASCFFVFIFKQVRTKSL